MSKCQCFEPGMTRCDAHEGYTVTGTGYADDTAPNRKPRPERTDGVGSGYVRGMPFWTHVTTSYGRETR